MELGLLGVLSFKTYLPSALTVFITVAQFNLLIKTEQVTEDLKK
jgi:hypothetical protein